MEVDPTRMCEKLVGLGEVDLEGIDDPGERTPLVVVIRSRKPRPPCGGCGGPVWSEGYRTAVLVDLPAFGRPVRLRWRKNAAGHARTPTVPAGRSLTKTRQSLRRGRC